MSIYVLLTAAAWLLAAVAAFQTDVAIFQLFIILSIFALILLNLGERRHGLSAYSVFNKDCQPILGQLQAEQFDAEIRRRPVDDQENATAQQQPLSNHDALLESTRREILMEQRKGRRTVPNMDRPRRRR